MVHISLNTTIVVKNDQQVDTSAHGHPMSHQPDAFTGCQQPPATAASTGPPGTQFLCPTVAGVGSIQVPYPTPLSLASSRLLSNFNQPSSTSKNLHQPQRIFTNRNLHPTFTQPPSCVRRTEEPSQHHLQLRAQVPWHGRAIGGHQGLARRNDSSWGPWMNHHGEVGEILVSYGFHMGLIWV